MFCPLCVAKHLKSTEDVDEKRAEIALHRKPFVGKYARHASGERTAGPETTVGEGVATLPRLDDVSGWRWEGILRVEEIRVFCDVKSVGGVRVLTGYVH